MVVNLILSLFVISGSLVIFSQTAGYPDYSGFAVVGPDAIPNCLAWFMLVIAVILMLTEMVKCLISVSKKEAPTYARAQLANTGEILSKLLKNKMGLLRLAGTLLLMALFAIFLKSVGFEICAVVFLTGCMLMNGVRKIWQLAVVSGGTVAVVYFVFVYALHVNLPMLFL